MRRTLKQMTLKLHETNSDLDNTWTLNNANFDSEVLLETLLHDYGDFYTLEQDPTLFKYEAEMWWKKHYRTFSKWWDGFDISYAPLENYNRREERLTKSSEEGSQYHKYNDAGSTDSFRTTGDTREGTRSHTEDTDVDTAKYTTGETTGSTSGTGNKTAGSKETWSRDKTTDTAQDFDTTVRQTNNNVNTSGRQIPIYDSQGHITGYTIVENTERSVEHEVSAYDDNSYVPGHIDTTHGSITDSGSLNSSTNTKTNNASGANRVTEHENGTKTITAATEDTSNRENTAGTNEGTELGNQKQNTTGTEIAHDSTTGTDEARGSSKTSGDSQTKNDLTREGQDSAYIHGNIGVTTSQQMLEAEIKIQLFNIYDAMAELFVDDHCICIYTNRKGGCIW